MNFTTICDVDNTFTAGDIVRFNSFGASEWGKVLGEFEFVVMRRQPQYQNEVYACVFPLAIRQKAEEVFRWTFHDGAIDIAASYIELVSTPETPGMAEFDSMF